MQVRWGGSDRGAESVGVEDGGRDVAAGDGVANAVGDHAAVGVV